MPDLYPTRPEGDHWRGSVRHTAASLVRRAALLCASPVAANPTGDDDLAFSLNAIADELERLLAAAPEDADALAEAADTLRTAAEVRHLWLERRAYAPAEARDPAAMLDSILWGSPADEAAALRTIRAIEACPDTRAVRQLVAAVMAAGRRQLEVLERAGLGSGRWRDGAAQPAPWRTDPECAGQCPDRGRSARSSRRLSGSGEGGGGRGRRGRGDLPELLPPLR